MRILICDDDPKILQLLHAYITAFFKLRHTMPELAVYTSADALLRQETRADIAFLDVEMPGVSGIQAGAILKTHNPRIKVFIVTSFPDYLDEAMRFQVFRYLSKPIDRDRLFRNLEDAMVQIALETHEYPIQTKDGIFIRQAEDIVCVERRGRDVLVHTPDKSYLSVETVEYWFHTLSLPCFIATHRSYLVNMRHINRIEKDRIHLKSGAFEIDAYLTRRKYRQVVDTYLKYIESVK